MKCLVWVGFVVRIVHNCPHRLRRWVPCGRWRGRCSQRPQETSNPQPTAKTADYQTTRNHPNARTYRTHRSEHALSIHPKPPNRVAIQARINSCHMKSTLMQVDHRRLRILVLPGNEMLVFGLVSGGATILCTCKASQVGANCIEGTHISSGMANEHPPI